MNTKYVIDSSTLISLAKIEELELLKKLELELYTVPEVFAETTQESILHGEIEGIEIRKLFEQKIIAQEKGKNIAIRGISGTDAKIIQLAQTISAIVLANDGLLGRKAGLRGLIALGSPDILLLAKEKSLLLPEFLF